MLGNMKNSIYIFVFYFLFVAHAQAAKIYLTGNSIDKKTVTTFGVCLAGGGEDDGWAEGWKELLTKANGGDVVIIRADGRRGGYEDWIYNDTANLDFPKVNSVRTITLAVPRDANSKEVVETLRKAELIFFAGGDQSLYINWLRNSLALQTINFLIHEKDVPIGGTSAGMALLAGTDYSAQYNSPLDNESMVTSADVMDDPLGKFVDLPRDVLIPDYMENVITDTHFSARNREGRIVGFMARALYNQKDVLNFSDVKGIAADEETAFCYGKNGIGHVYGKSQVFFLRGNAPIERIEEGKNLHWSGNHQAVQVYRVNSQNPASFFDLTKWTGVGGESEFWWIDGSNGVHSSREIN